MGKRPVIRGKYHLVVADFVLEVRARLEPCKPHVVLVGQNDRMIGMRQCHIGIFTQL